MFYAFIVLFGLACYAVNLLTCCVYALHFIPCTNVACYIMYKLWRKRKKKKGKGKELNPGILSVHD